MGMTLAEKVLARHSNRSHVRPGELVMADVDFVLGTDVTTALSVTVFEQMGATRVFDPARIALVNDHFVPAKDISAAGLSQAMKQFARQYGIEHYFEVGRSGICHVLLPEEGLVLPGELIVGADSHTCTYGALGALATGIGSTDMAAAWALGQLWFRVPETIRVEIEGALPETVGGKDIILHVVGKLGVDGARYQALEFGGSGIRALPMHSRLTVCNMAIEAGAKTGMVPHDEVTEAYLQGRAKRSFRPEQPDGDATYARVVNVDVSGLEPQVACPYLPSNVVPVSEVQGIQVDQVVIGSCTNGMIEDLQAAARVLAQRQVHPRTRLVVIPGSRSVFVEAVRQGLIETFATAGAVVCPPTCGPCIGGHMGVLGEDEVGLYTTNRNFKGRAGARSSKVYLCGPEVAAASAVAGEIADPRS